MRYRIGEVSALFGMTKEGIRYYERKGIISSLRDEQNGYRYYPRDTITRLKQMHAYQKMGFSLEEAHEMTMEVSCEVAKDRIERKLQEVAAQEARLRRARQELEEQRAIMQRFFEHRIELRELPEMLFMKRIDNEESGKTPAERRLIAEAQAEEKIWTKAMPPVKLCAKFYDRDLTPRGDVFGSIVDRADAEALQLPMDRAVTLPAGTYLYGLADAPRGEAPEIRPMLEWMEKQGYQLAGDIYCNLFLAYKHDEKRDWSLHEVLMPVERIIKSQTNT